MATEKMLNTRILLKYDTLVNWMKDSITLKAGEIAIATIDQVQNGSTGMTPPAVGIKVGDGSSKFSTLPWIQAVAGDVTARMKQFAGEADIDAAIAELSSRKLATVAELNAAVERIGALEAKVNSTVHGNEVLKSAIDTLSTNTTNSLNTKIDKSVAEEATASDKLVKQSTVNSAISTAKTAILGQADGADFNGTVKGAYEVAASAKADAKTANDAIGSTEYVGGTLTAAVAALQASVGNSSEGLGSQVADLQTRMGEAETAIGTKAAQSDLETLQGRVTTAEGKITTAEGKITTLEGEMDVVQATLVNFDGTNTISKKFASIEERIGAIDSENGTVKALQTAVNLLNSDKSIEGSVAHTAATAVAEIVAGADADYDTLKEIADWITNDTTGAAEMANDIAEMQSLLGVTEGSALPKSVDTRISEAIAAENLSQYATDEDMNGAVKRIEDLEKAIGSEGSVKESIDDAKEELIGTSNDVSTANTIYGAKKYAEEKAAAAQSAAEATAAADATQKANAAQAAAEQTAKSNLDKLAGYTVGETASLTVAKNAEHISSLSTLVNGIIVNDNKEGIVSSVTQDSETHKISVTHKKITMDEMDENAVFVFYCGTASEVI